MTVIDSSTHRPVQRIDLRRLVRPGRPTAFPMLTAESVDDAVRPPSVRIAQLLLRRYYATLRVDGAFGPQTRAAVMAFQVRAHLPASGMLRDQDWAALGDRSVARIGCRGNAVRAGQELINHHLDPGDRVIVDGLFGTGTAMQVRYLQRQTGIAVTGVLDRPTLGTLLH